MTDFEVCEQQKMKIFVIFFIFLCGDFVYCIGTPTESTTTESGMTTEITTTEPGVTTEITTTEPGMTTEITTTEPGMTTEITTTEPEPVQNITFGTTEFKWYYPHPLIPPSQFELVLTSKYEEDAESSQYYNTSKPYFDLNNTKPATTYTLSVTVFDNNQRSVVVKKSVNFPSNKPPKPRNIKVENIAMDRVRVSWKINSERKGKILDCKVNIKEKSEVNTGCKAYENETSIDTSFDYYDHSVKPYYNYHYTIKCRTGRGYGYSNEKDYQSNPGVPEKVKELELIDFREVSIRHSSFKVKYTLKWKKPCMLNGPFKYFLIEIESCDSKIPNQYQTKENTYSFIAYLPHCKYKAVVYVVLENGIKSSGDKVNFTTPLGQPDEVRNLTYEIGDKSIINTDTYKVDYILRWDYTLSNRLDYKFLITINDCKHTTEKRTTNLNLPLNDLRPYCEHNIYVKVIINNNKSRGVKVVFTTPVPYPTNFDLKEQMEDIFVTWEYHDLLNYKQTNILKSYTRIEINGLYTEDEHYNPFNKIEKHITSPFKFKNFNSSYNYNFTLIVEVDNQQLVQSKYIRTQDGTPWGPNVQSTDNAIQWSENKVRKGKIQNYTYCIETVGPIEEDCDFIKKEPECETVNASVTRVSYVMKTFYKYKVSVSATTSKGTNTTIEKIRSNSTNQIDLPRNIEYCIQENQLSGNFTAPCRLYNYLKGYRVKLLNMEINKHSNIDLKNNKTFVKNLNSSSKYSVQITILTYSGQKETAAQEFITSPDIPVLNSTIPEPKVTEENVIEFKMRNDYFNPKVKILYYALLLYKKGEIPGASNRSLIPARYCLPQDFSTWTTQWPEETTGKTITEKLWNPFKKDEVETIIKICPTRELQQKISNCIYEELNQIEYYIILRAFTEFAYGQSHQLHFKISSAKIDTGAIVGIVFGVLLMLVIGGAIIFYNIRDEKPLYKDLKNTNGMYSCTPNNFPMYWKRLQTTDEALKLQFTDLVAEAQRLGKSNQAALLPENKRLNRYANILPYDATRVVLPDGTYINASYIKGKSGQIEYIASQGPLEHTNKDFWNMVITEDVSIIVMVTQFYENKKEKCYEYFPTVNSTMLEDEITIQCTEEEFFDNYYLRNIELQKGDDVIKIRHFHFLSWPDFGVPKNTRCVIQLIKAVRRYHKYGKILVHCSAGVGRTGTFITLDINMGLIDENKDINVYKTVLDLRKQRVLMVQTYAQYEFIHNCLASYIMKEDESIL